ncbi:sodium:proton antiporter [Solwaraspora sp. WMMA2101]|uniref:sodium:proton antiporter n=1 Tax=Solwaraspora sp. WMMA2101 TaxID=3404124 RepID=UPI003B956904
MTVALMVGILTAAGVYLILHRGLIRVIIGFVLLGHAVNALLLAAGGLWRREPPLGEVDLATTADPLPQAFALTAIVITFGITVYLLALTLASPPERDRPDLELGEPSPTPAAQRPAPPAGPAAGAPAEPVLTEPRAVTDELARDDATAGTDRKREGR